MVLAKEKSIKHSIEIYKDQFSMAMIVTANQKHDPTSNSFNQSSSWGRGNGRNSNQRGKGTNYSNNKGNGNYSNDGNNSQFYQNNQLGLKFLHQYQSNRPIVKFIHRLLS